MNGRYLFLPPTDANAVGHLPSAPSPERTGGLSLPASPLCESAAFHMVRRDRSKVACALCPPPCPDCHGQGYRITTDDGTRPPCITCDGLGWLIRSGARRHG